MLIVSLHIIYMSCLATSAYSFFSLGGELPPFYFNASLLLLLFGMSELPVSPPLLFDPSLNINTALKHCDSQHGNQHDCCVTNRQVAYTQRIQWTKRWVTSLAGSQEFHFTSSIIYHLKICRLFTSESFHLIFQTAGDYG